MIQTNALLELRNKIKDKKPDFIREDYQRRKRLGRKLKWKKPKGIHSKIRHRFKGRRKMPSPGYKSPRKVKGLNSSGLKMINVHSIDGIVKINKESQGAIVAKNVGIKKKLGILKRAKELNVAVLNLNVDEQIKKIEEFISSKKKKGIKEPKKEPNEQKETKSKEKEGKTYMSGEDKKDLEKAEKDKILTKKV